MPQITANGISIEYESHGDPAHEPLLLVMGLGAQLTLWPIEFVEALTQRGFHVIRFDNRDIGLSEKFDAAGVPSIPEVLGALMAGRNPLIAYSLADMAQDAAALLDALGIERAHIVGASMGGMIVQHMAASHAHKVRTMTSIMSTTGNRMLPPARPEAMAALLMAPPSLALDDILTTGVYRARAIGSPAYPAAEDRLRARIERDFHRSYNPAGMARQFAAVVADGDRREMLRQIAVPTLVIHGEDDPLVTVDGGKDTAATIPGARLHIVPGMGHDLPLELNDTIAEAIAVHARVG